MDDRRSRNMLSKSKLPWFVLSIEKLGLHRLTKKTLIPRFSDGSRQRRRRKKIHLPIKKTFAPTFFLVRMASAFLYGFCPWLSISLFPFRGSIPFLSKFLVHSLDDRFCSKIGLSNCCQKNENTNKSWTRQISSWYYHILCAIQMCMIIWSKLFNIFE